MGKLFENGRYDARKLKASLAPVFAVAKESPSIQVATSACVWISETGLQAEGRGLRKTVDVSIGRVTRNGNFAIVPAKDLADALGSCDGMIEINATSKGLTVGPIQIQSCPFPPDDMPAVPRPPEGEQDERTISPFMEALAVVSAAVSADETRPHLRSILWGDRAAVSTDGHRLHAVFHSPQNEERDRGLGLMPAWIAGVIAKGKPEAVTMVTAKSSTTGSNHWQRYDWTDNNGASVSLIFADDMISEFPPYEQVIPSEKDRDSGARIVVKGSELRAVAKMASAFIKDRTGGVKISQNDVGLLVQGERPGVGAADWHLPVVSGKLPEGFVCGFNARYLLDAVNAVAPDKGNEAVLCFQENALDPLVITGTVLGAEALCVVMPMRV